MTDESMKCSQVISLLAIHAFDWLQKMCSAYEKYAAGWVNEREWSEELTKYYLEKGYDARHQCYYPGSRQSCDVVVTIGGAEFWLEIKGGWLITHPYLTEDGKQVGGNKNPVFKKHMFHEDESTLKDLTTKLSQIQGTDKYVGVLLIAFDSISMSIDDDIAQLTQLANLAVEPWTTLYRGWSHPKDKNYRCRNWFWFKPATQVFETMV